MGLKFLRDGADSANLVSMHSLDGTPGDWNFFSTSFTTNIGNTDDKALKALAQKFSSATDYVTACSVMDWGKSG